MSWGERIFLVLFYLAIIAVIVALGFSVFNVVTGRKPQFHRSMLRYGALAGGIMTVQLMLISYGLKYVEVSRFFPVTASSAIVLSAVLSAFWQKEVPSTLTVAGMVLSVCAIVFFSIG